MCSSCRGRFGLPVTSTGACEVCVALQRLNRLVLTRHPAEESDTLRRLLTRTVSKIEGFVEEWEANQALQGPLFGGVSLGIGAESLQGSRIPGLTPVSKKASAPPRKTSGDSPCRREVREEEGGKASGSKAPAPSPRRSRSKEEKKDKKKKRRHSSKRSHDRDRDRRRKKTKETVEEEPPRKEEEEEEDIEEEVDFGDNTEESTTREGKKSPLKSQDGEPIGADKREEKAPKSPSRSPPGFRREYRPEEDTREPLERKPDKPKKDKGYNHYLRGQDFRDKYGYNRGRGRGTTYYAPRW